MAKKQMIWKTKGMNRDLSVSAFNPEFAFENMNLRLSTNEGNTLMSWVNEKGTAQVKIVTGNWVEGDSSTKTIITSIEGTPIGTAVINHQLVIFSKGTSRDFIYILKYSDEEKTKMLCKMLFEGNLGFDTEHPLETLVSYEAENIQKIYWTDGINQPRVINIEGNIILENNTQFDFVPELQLKEVVKVKKLLGANGMFAPGVIQYAFTYYKKNGQETNIFYTSPLLYISYKDRGASPEDKVENAFQITVENPDLNFDYLRIYSIQRTSIDATPITKRIRDISLEGLEEDFVSYIDTGTTGNSVDPMELLYKGGESVTAETMEQKNGTLFLGNLSISRPIIKDGTKELISTTTTLSDATRTILPQEVSYYPYAYANQLTSKGSESRYEGKTVPCGGFKTGDYYRCGVQFQYKTGKWSDPVWVKDWQVQSISSYEGSAVTLPIIEGSLTSSVAESLKTAGYRKVRPVVVFPSMLDRNTICQGVTCPTLYTKAHRNDKDLYAQSSWFFRPYCNNEDTKGKDTTTMYPKSSGELRYTNRQIDNQFPKKGGTAFKPEYMRQVEIEGHFEDYKESTKEGGNKFVIDREFRTLHSPDVEFDPQLSLVDFLNVEYKEAGSVKFDVTMSDIDIQTETPTVSSGGSGFVHKAFTEEGPKGIVSGLFYQDYLVDDDVKDTGEVGSYPYIKASPSWLIYPWQGSGSLNNDMNRPADKGAQTAKLKKKVISNLRYASTTLNSWSSRGGEGISGTGVPQLFSSEENTIVKVGDKIYKGNIDTSIVPDEADGAYFCYNGLKIEELIYPFVRVEHTDDITPFNSTNWCKTFSRNVSEADGNGLYMWYPSHNLWARENNNLGDIYVDLVVRKLPVRMKYKSSPHLVLNTYGFTENQDCLSIVEIRRLRDETTDATRFGGQTEDALRENRWIPCGEPVSLDTPTFYYEYGDTYFQRYDCLKTYPFTREDPNQIVEIGSFMLETRVNIDGRYDRNRGQANNINMSPQNFNLLNTVYSQTDNFFSYTIQPDEDEKSNYYPNQITWSLTKTSGADVDTWTTMTLASVLEMDGNKGQVRSLQRFNDMLICFQDTGISQILYDESVQVASTNGVPIEIANSGKVQGKRYFTDTIGCSNKWSIVNTPAGIYFIDNNDKSIYEFGEGLKNVSQNLGFNPWCKSNIPSADNKWTPTGFGDFKCCYDKLNQDVLFINKDTALAFSERMATFTSFYDYGNVPFFCNLDDTGIWIKGNQLWKHHGGDYCKFFGINKPYWMTLVGNPEPQMDKIFTNLQLRACVDGEGWIDYRSKNDTFDRTFDFSFHPDGSAYGYERFVFYLPFTSIEVWNEHQHGYTQLDNKFSKDAYKHFTSDNISSLHRKFRLWGCDIPRNNCELDSQRGSYSYPYSKDSELGIARFYRKPMDRMRNTWIYLKFMKDASVEDITRKTEIHDIVMTYFN